MSIKERVDPHLLRAASASVVAAGKGPHALLETIGAGAPRHRPVPVTEWVRYRETASGAAWRAVASIASDGVAVEL